MESNTKSKWMRAFFLASLSLPFPQPRPTYKRSILSIVRLLGNQKLENPEHRSWDFPGSPVVETLCFHCRECRFNPWLANQDPTCGTKQPKNNNKKSIDPLCFLSGTAQPLNFFFLPWLSTLILISIIKLSLSLNSNPNSNPYNLQDRRQAV